MPVYAHILCTLYSANGEVSITRYADRSDETLFFSVTVRDASGRIIDYVCADSLERAVDRLLEQSQARNHRALVIIESCLYEYEWLRQLELLKAAG